MSSYLERDAYSQAGDWLFGTVRRNPEALLLMAAGCCLMMRRNRSSARGGMRGAHAGDEWDYRTSRASSQMRHASAEARDGLARAGERAADTAKTAGEYGSQMKDRIADTASDYASQMKDRISETASSYADMADDARRRVVERSAQFTRQAQSTVHSSMQRVLREQPLAVAIAGLAAGAAVAAMFPTTELEDRAFGDAREKLRDVAEKTRDRVVDAAGKVGERLKSAAEERGLTSEGLKDVAGEVVDTFKGAMSGQSEEQGGATPASGTSGSGHNFGTDQRQLGTTPGSSGGTSASGPTFGSDQRQAGGATQGSNSAGTGGRSIR
jgi:gas vesicle protein